MAKTRWLPVPRTLLTASVVAGVAGATLALGGRAISEQDKSKVDARACSSAGEKLLVRVLVVLQNGEKSGFTQTVALNQLEIGKHLLGPATRPLTASSRRGS